MNFKSSPHASDTKAEVEQLTIKLNEKIAKLRTSDGYRDYLRMQSRFPHYSLNNCLLIMAQKPDAQHVAGYTVWTSLGRHVNAGEHGIRIMAPRTYKRASDTENGAGTELVEASPKHQQIHLYFRPISVFDISQTSGDPLPTLTVDELQGRVDGYGILMDSLMETSPVPVRFETITSGAKGYYSPTSNEIVVNIGMGEKQTLKTLAHEIGHAVTHSPDNPAAKEKAALPKKQRLNRSLTSSATITALRLTITRFRTSVPGPLEWMTNSSPHKSQESKAPPSPSLIRQIPASAVVCRSNAQRSATKSLQAISPSSEIQQMVSSDIICTIQPIGKRTPAHYNSLRRFQSRMLRNKCCSITEWIHRTSPKSPQLRSRSN